MVFTNSYPSGADTSISSAGLSLKLEMSSDDSYETYLVGECLFSTTELFSAMKLVIKLSLYE